MKDNRFHTHLLIYLKVDISETRPYNYFFEDYFNPKNSIISINIILNHVRMWPESNYMHTNLIFLKLDLGRYYLEIITMLTTVTNFDRS